MKHKKLSFVQNFFCAFSLVEILISLIIISLILAALVPVMNKQLKKQANALDTKLVQNCPKWKDNNGNPLCLLCWGTRECVVCKNECTANSALRTSDCVCVDKHYNDEN